MADVVCLHAVQVLNAIFSTPLILNDGHEILQRLEAGDEVADIAEDLGQKFGQPGQAPIRGQTAPIKGRFQRQRGGCSKGIGFCGRL